MAVSYLNGMAKGYAPDRELFPYKQRTIDIEGNIVQYVDEGEGTPLVLIHPLPAWSFIYRNFIPVLKNHFRCIAFDVPGFGFSTPASDFQQTPRHHARLIAQLLATLDLQETVLYLHDTLGGAGLWAALEERQRMKGLILSTTFAWPLDKYPDTRSFLSMISSTFPGSLIMLMLMRVYFRNARYRQHEAWTDAEKRAYTRNFGRPQRRNMQTLFRNVLKDTAFYTALEKRLPELSHLPVFLPWGTEDGAIQMGWLSRFEQIFPRHTSLILEGAHHFPQEHAPDSVTKGILDWWRTVNEA